MSCILCCGKDRVRVVCRGSGWLMLCTLCLSEDAVNPLTMRTPCPSVAGEFARYVAKMGPAILVDMCVGQDDRRSLFLVSRSSCDGPMFMRLVLSMGPTMADDLSLLPHDIRRAVHLVLVLRGMIVPNPAFTGAFGRPVFVELSANVEHLGRTVCVQGSADAVNVTVVVDVSFKVGA